MQHYWWVFQMYFLGLWTPQLEHHLIPLHLRKGRNLSGQWTVPLKQYLQNQLFNISKSFNITIYESFCHISLMIKDLVHDSFPYIKCWHLKVYQQPDNKAPRSSEVCMFSETEVTGRFTAGGLRWRRWCHCENSCPERDIPTLYSLHNSDFYYNVFEYVYICLSLYVWLFTF